MKIIDNSTTILGDEMRQKIFLVPKLPNKAPKSLWAPHLKTTSAPNEKWPTITVDTEQQISVDQNENNDGR